MPYLFSTCNVTENGKEKGARPTKPSSRIFHTGEAQWALVNSSYLFPPPKNIVLKTMNMCKIQNCYLISKNYHTLFILIFNYCNCKDKNHYHVVTSMIKKLSK